MASKLQLKLNPPSRPTGVSGLHNSNKYSDMTIICGTRVWKAHRAIVCSQCAFFDRACEGKFKEGLGNQKEINLAEDDPAAVAAMLQYFYTSVYDTNVCKPEEVSEGVFHIAVYQIADKYLLDDLNHVAFGKYRTFVTNNWRLPSFFSVIDKVRELGLPHNDPLYDEMLTITRKHIKSLLKIDDFKETMKKHPEILINLFKDYLHIR